MSLNTVIPMSPREQTALSLAEFATCSGLAEVYAGGYEKRTDKKGKPYWSIPLCKARILDGEVMVYSPYFMVLKYQTAIRSLPRQDSMVFKGDVELKEFIVKNFVN